MVQHGDNSVEYCVDFNYCMPPCHSPSCVSSSSSNLLLGSSSTAQDTKSLLSRSTACSPFPGFVMFQIASPPSLPVLLEPFSLILLATGVV